MNIFYFHKFDLASGGWGGSSSMLCALRDSFISFGNSVDVVTPRHNQANGNGFVRYALPFAQPLTFGPEKRPGEITIDEIATGELSEMARAAAEKIEREAFGEQKPDLLLANHINLMALTCWHLNQKLGIPYRIISYGTDTQLLLRDRRYRELFGEAAKRAERIFAISEFVASEISQTVGGKVETLGGAIHKGLFFPPATKPVRARRLVYVGRLVTEKGIWVLLDAISRQKTATELVMVGEGPLAGRISQFVARNGLNCHVRLLGCLPQSPVREVLISADAAVVPSIWQEPLGLVVLEALACGLPVIASAVGGIPEMIKDRFNGLLVQPDDSVALAGAIDRLLSDENLYNQIKAGVDRTVVPTYDDLAMRVIT
jgi:glycosyltransferase involved in cell wall biosynthesis